MTAQLYGGESGRIRVVRIAVSEQLYSGESGRARVVRINETVKQVRTIGGERTAVWWRERSG